MAIADIAAYAHLSEADIEALGDELDSIRRDIEDSLGERDAAYIRRTILFQRTLDVAARLRCCGDGYRAHIDAFAGFTIQVAEILAEIPPATRRTRRPAAPRAT